MEKGLDAADAEKLKKAIEKLTASADRVAGSGISVGGFKNSNNINLGGMGVWVCVTCVLIMLVVIFYQSADVLDLRRKYDRMQDHLSAIYMMAPQLRPKDVNDHSDNSASDEDSTGEGSSPASP